MIYRSRPSSRPPVFYAGFLLAPTVAIRRADVQVVRRGYLGLLLAGPVVTNLFVPWDRLYERVVSDRPLDLVFDERCLFCARSLLPLQLLDVNEAVTFYTQRDAPARYRERADVDFEGAMYVFDEDGVAYASYDAFRELLRQYRVCFPLVSLMGLGPVARVGRRVYASVAATRSRHFECAVEPDSGRDA